MAIVSCLAKSLHIREGIRPLTDDGNCSTERGNCMMFKTILEVTFVGAPYPLMFTANFH